MDIAEFLISRGADVSAASRSGNTPLHTAAFFRDFKMVNLLLKHGASATLKNRRGQTPIDVISSPWSRHVADTYKKVADDADFKIDLERIERDRPRMVKLLRESAAKAKASDEKKRRNR